MLMNRQSSGGGRSGPTRGVQRRPPPAPVAVNPALPLRAARSRLLRSPQEPLARGGTIDAASALSRIIIDPRSPADALAAAAAPLFVIVAQLRNTLENADVEALRGGRWSISFAALRSAPSSAQARGGDISAARYVMCALIDEAVMTTPWGSSQQLEQQQSAQSVSQRDVGRREGLQHPRSHSRRARQLSGFAEAARPVSADGLRRKIWRARRSAGTPR